MNRICLVGDILIDVSLGTVNEPLKMRLGGVIHSARALWALEVEYSIAFFAPKYLYTHIIKYLKEIGNPEIIYLGEVISCPYVMLINEVKEIGNQGYDFLLREDIEIIYLKEDISKLKNFSNFLVISGNFDFKKVISTLPKGSKISIDFANNIRNFNEIKTKHKFENVFISTSSNYFIEYYKNNSDFNIEKFFSEFKEITKKIILKENRGGSRAFDFKNKCIIKIVAQTQPIAHSVGVGDVYNASFLSFNLKNKFEESLCYAAFIATEYALTTYPEDFKRMTSRICKIPVNEIIDLRGVSLPWEIRKEINIYIAAPDFDFVDTKHIDHLESNLKYHNFSPLRPIKVNGQMENDATTHRKEELFQKDMILLNKSKILVAVLLYNDPGTLIEIGIAAERKIPTLIYDPYNIAKNCMLTQIPDLLTDNMDEIICKIFEVSDKTYAK